jgi:hypothetical protein
MSAALCKHRDIFGAPRTGVHALRIPLLDIAVVDIVCTVAAGWALARAARIQLWLSMCLVFGAGIVLHRAFCVRTTIDKALFQGA